MGARCCAGWERGGPAAARVLRVTREVGEVGPAPPGARYPAAWGTQVVWRVRDLVVGNEAVFNESRKKKPRGFRGGSGGGAVACLDPLAEDGSGRCDFCEWKTATAADSWGRAERPGAVTASNLWRLGAQHGLCLFKRHDPLDFSRDDLVDVLEASQDWFEASLAASGRSRPLFIWNCLPRAGASQFHGHAQLFLGDEHLPQPRRVWEGDARHRRAHGVGYIEDLAAAHDEFGVLHRVRRPSRGTEGAPSLTLQGEGACIFPSLCPAQDMELNVIGAGLRDPGFQQAMFMALRFLIDDLGVTSFGACIYAEAVEPAYQQMLARIVSRGGTEGNRSSDYGSLEVFGGVSVGKTSPFILSDLLGDALRAPRAD